MSRPENRLARYNTYTAAHVLIMADSMETIEGLMDNPAGFERVSNSPEARYDPQTLFPDSGNKYVILYDGRQDTNFYIQDVEWEVILAPVNNTDSGNKYADTIETTGAMKVIEPLGLDFLEILSTSTAELGVAPNAVIFALKTLFIGYTDDGPEIVDDIRPLSFTIYDLKSKSTSTGTEYDLGFVATTNGTAKLPQISYIANGMSLNIQAGWTLGQALSALQDRLNARYEAYRNDLIQSLGSSSTIDIEEDYKKVKYEINVADVYKASPYIVGEFVSDDRFVDTNDFIIKIPENASVDSAIRKVIETCHQIDEDAADLKEGFTVKIVSSLAPDTENYKVSFFVERYKNVYQVYGEELNPQPGEVLELDYIYTGRNIDILNFDMDIDMGMAFFQTAITTKSDPTEQKETPSVLNFSNTTVANGPEKGSNNANVNTTKTPPSRKSPLFLGMLSSDPVSQNTKNATVKSAYDQLLARQFYLENVSASIEIVGNPQLLNETSPSFRDISTGGTEETTPDTTGANQLFSSPALLKVNVKYPTDKNDLSEFKQFWYDGFYRMRVIKNVFKEGVFTQQIEMNAIPETNKTPEVTATQENNKRATPIYHSGVTGDVTGVGGTDAPEPRVGVDDGQSGASILKKVGVNISGAKPEITSIYDDIVEVWQTRNAGVRPVITSGNDGKHKVGSLHGKNLAIDVRGNNIPLSKAYELRTALAARLGRDYDVLFEEFGIGNPNNHFHIEYDPKGVSQAAEDESGSE